MDRRSLLEQSFFWGATAKLLLCIDEGAASATPHQRTEQLKNELLPCRAQVPFSNLSLVDPDRNISFFDPWRHVDIHGSKLPHWQQLGSIYFVTFRLADSLPIKVLDRWRDERNQWLQHDPEPWTPDIEQEYHLLFSLQIDQWLDQGHGECPLRERTCRDSARSVFEHSDESLYFLHSWVIMPNHVHLLFTLHEDQKLQALLKIWKRVSARNINRLLERTGQSLWREGYFDRMIRDANHYRNVARYIRNNPVKAQPPPTTYTLYESESVADLLNK